MTPITVSKLRAIAGQNGYRGVITLVFGDEDFAGSSFGASTDDCAAMGELLDAIVRRIESGELEVWPSDA